MQLGELTQTMCCIQGILVGAALLFGLNLVSANASSSSDCLQTSESALANLKKRLFCNYDLDDIPLDPTMKMVHVTYFILPVMFMLDEYSNELSIDGSAVMAWHDLRLVWNRTEYGGLKNIVVNNKDVWVPDIDIYTYASMASTSSYLPTRQCEVSDDGLVLCRMSLRYLVHCNPDVKRWPFDSANCNLNVVSKMDQVRFDLSITAVKGKTYFDSDRYWKIVSFDQSLETTDEASMMKWPKLVYNITFKRHSEFLVATFVMPSVVMLMATGSTFCLDPEGAARLFVIGANMISHCLFLMFLAWYIPPNGDKTPVIVTFFSDSFILVGVSVIITICAGKMRAAARAPPAWVSSIADGIQDSPVQNLLFNGLFTRSDAVDKKESDTVATVMTSSTSNKWRRIATLLDRISLLVFAAIITFLSCSFIL